MDHSSPVVSINDTNTSSKGIVQITIQSTRDDFTKTLTCLVIPSIADSIPSESFPRNAIEIPSNINLADPEFHISRSIDLLIGSGATLSLLDVVDRFAGEQRIIWHFIPPRAPHFGGIWEAMVKLFKHHLKRVVGDSLFTFEELNTFIIEVEGILNSRPITSLSSDPSDMLVLIPAHYMIGKPLIAPPESDVTSVPVNRISTWQHITRVRQHFWTRWSLEYLNELQIRNKWIKDGPNLEIGTIVLIKDKGLACNQWIFGRIVAVHPGEDGITRAATIKTATGEVKRATRSLCPVPIER
ncbi:PREDICTED: uncharacterized protein LOC108759105 [Trachymyrmex cornetzi]|uniref:uncharacterized protein LOC108759105 n=1 Tax=Trachymyrmex cornetzi TaxID=471704 RepID=UPI00084F2CF6|nr:PREDICTED: uncharacterized protein LOC108759105 [Trachymyrmex cornetzi]